MTFDKVLVLINVIICSIMFIRLFTFRRNGKSYCKTGGRLAWLMMFYASSIPVLAYFDSSYQTDLQNIFANSIICIALLKYRGNVTRLFK
ncbi:phage holin family protein [Arsenophonus sp. aPb]|uniref:phage holin family protein n=1 Tax=Arsenophonus sp. aPb TaxID=3041619 RepID=UPI0024683497|nr:phage holin family protein [Arsenophonus sp. aPb]WGL97340.1 phage holin family protein [Arsenophonus sp. aPb]